LKSVGIWLVCLLILFSPLAAGAAWDGYYATAGTGFLFYTGDASEKTELDYAAEFELSFGQYFAKHYSHEVTVGYIHDGHIGDDLKMYTLSLAVMRRFPVSRKVSLFAGGGFMAAFFSDYHGHIYGVETRDNDFRPGINLLTGAQIDLAWDLFVRFQLSYRLIRELRLDGDTLDPSGVSGVLKFGYHF